MSEIKSRPQLPNWLKSGQRSCEPNTGIGEVTALEASHDFTKYHAATNAGDRLIDLIHPILMGDECLIITGFQDLLSALSIIMEIRPGITHSQPGTIRMLFGTNTDSLRHLSGPRMRLPDHVKQHYMSQSGVFVHDTRDLRAIQACPAIKSGAIRIRVFDEEKAQDELGFYPGMMHAKLFVSEDFASAGSATFSRRGLTSNIEFADRLAGGFDAHSERQKSGELFWNWGRDWKGETLQILDHLIREVSAEDAMARVIDGMTGFKPWRQDRDTARPDARLSGEQADFVYAASQVVYENGFVFMEAARGTNRALMGRHVAANIADTYERTVLRDDSIVRRHGCLAILPRIDDDAWHRTGTALKVIVPSDGAIDTRALEESFATVAGLLAETDVEPHKAPAIWVAGMKVAGSSGTSVPAIASAFKHHGSIFASDGLLRDILSIDAVTALENVVGANGDDWLGRIYAPFQCRMDRSSIGEAKSKKDIGFPTRCIVRPIIKTTTAQADTLRGIMTAVTKIIGDDRTTELERELRASLRISSGYACHVWIEQGLGNRFREVEGGRKVKIDTQGVLPIFAQVEDIAKTPVTDRIEKLLSARAMTGLDKSRTNCMVEAICGPVLEDGVVFQDCALCVVVVPDAAAVHYIARALAAELGDRACGWVTSVERSAIGDEGLDSGAGYRVVESLDDLDIQDGGRQPRVVVMSQAQARSIEIDNVSEIFFPCLPQDADDLVSCLGLIDRPGIGERTLTVIAPENFEMIVDIDPKDRAIAVDRFLTTGTCGASVRFGELADVGDILESLFASQALPVQLHQSVSGLLSEMRDHIDDERYTQVVSHNPAGVWGAELATLPSATRFTAFFLSGKTGRRGGDFMPPRIVIVQEGEDGDVILRNQVSCLDMLSRTFEDARMSGAVESVPDLAQDGSVLEAVGRHLSEVTHWDLRPERTVGLLKHLADFLSESRLTCDGASLFGDMSLPCLELLCDRWVQRIGVSWIEAKQDIYDCGDDVSLPTITRVLEALSERPSWEVDDVRLEMSALVADLRFEDRERSKSIQDRVSVIVHGDPTKIL